MVQKYINAQIKKRLRFDKAVKYWSSKRTILEKKSTAIANKDLKYQSYFTSSIHTYEKGHLNWKQALCHIQASGLMCIKDIMNDKSFKYTPEETYKFHIVNNISLQLKSMKIENIADFGCGTGDLTHLLAVEYPNAYIVGLDLSPNYLSIAQYKYNDYLINWIHANMEFSSLETDMYDTVIICYAFHEMVPDAIVGSINEAYRILRNKGKIIIVDMDPEKLPLYPSFIDTCEPHLKQYRKVRILELLCNSGFINYERINLHKMSSLFVGTKVI